MRRIPGYSSHQYSVCDETEISNINDVAGESSRLYQSLQQSVDEEIQHTGFVPDHGYGMDGKTNGNGSANGHTNRSNGHPAPSNGNLNACKLAGMNDYLTKPVSSAALREIIQKWLPVAGKASTR